MARYSIGQLQTILRQAGWPEELIVIMAAVGMAESSGNSEAINPGHGAGGRRTREYSVGLWQINTLVHRNYTVGQLKDPITNAREALRIYRMQGLRAWGAYIDKRYQRYMASSQTAYTANSASINRLVDIKEGLLTDVPMIAVFVAVLILLVARER